MKKIIVILSLIGILMSFINTNNINANTEKRAIFISYIELSKYLHGKKSSDIKYEIDRMITNINNSKFNTIILQVRMASDSIYKSKIYPFSQYINDNEELNLDILDYFVKKSHKHNIELFAWINPYRIRTVEDISSITKNNPAYKYLNTDYVYINNGIYFNPAKKEIEDLIVNGVKEVLNYSIDGLLFDDYFYPSNDIDINDYIDYCENNKKISIEQYHLNIINHLIERVHNECINKNIYFGISPDGNIDNNYKKNMADVKRWMKSNKYIDFIMPQVYYGFYNSTKGYLNVIKEWESLLKTDDVDLWIALAFYKVGVEDKYAKEGRDEWVNHNNIIMREVILSRNLKNYKGFSLFRYDNLFDKELYNNNSIGEINNLLKILG